MKKPPRRPTLRNPRLAFEALEPRALLSADLLPVDALPDPLPPAPAEFRAVESASPMVQLTAPTARELVIIDAAVADGDALATHWAQRGFEVLRLDPASDALGQIGALLAQRTGLDAVHLVTHGTTGGIALGGAMLDAAGLSARSPEIAKWADAFAPDGDLLLYACDLAAGDGGQAFLERLAMLTGADVAASTDATGAALLGGDWALERAVGAIESASLPPVDAWFGLLVVDTLDWDAVLAAGQWPDSSLGPNVLSTALGGTVTGTVTGDTGFLDAVGGGDLRITPVISTRVDAGTGQNTLQLQMDGLAPGQGVTLTLDFSAYAFGVSNISFAVFDVDSGGFIDRITVTSDRGDPTTLGTSIYNTTSGTNTIVGNNTGNSDNNAGDGNATFTYTWSLANENSGIRTLNIRYGNDGAPTGQGIGIHDLTFDPTPGASNRTVNATEDQAYTFSTADFGFQDVGGDALETVRITQLPTAGTLHLNGVAVTLGQSIAATDVTADLLTFHPAADANGAGYANFRFRVGDGTSLSQSDYAMTLNVAAVNDAPTLSGGPFAFAGTNEDTASAGTLVSALLAGLTHGDVDASALSGIAVTASTGSGTWQYSTDGVTWNGVGGVAPSSALLLSSTTLVRYVPDGANGESAQLTFRAWDRTSGAASDNTTRQTADTTANGDATAFSTGTAQATMAVTDVNDAPVLNAARTPVLASVNEDALAPVGAVGTLVSSLVDFAVPAGQVDNVTDVDTGAQLGIALVGADTAQGDWFYSLDNGANWSVLPAVGPANALLLAADAGTRLYFQPDPDYAGTLAAALTFRAWDHTSGAAGTLVNPGAGGGTTAFSIASDTASLTVIGINDPPVLANLAGDARSYAAGTGAVIVDQGAAAAVSDTDSADFAGGNLTVSIVAGRDPAEDVLAIAVSAPTVTLSAGMTVGSTVSVNGVAIGTLASNGVGVNDLVVSLNANANVARVSTLLAAITYANTDTVSPTPGTRTIRFTVDDGDGGASTSAAANATITVKPVASIAATDAAAAEPADNGRFTVTLSAASATDTVLTYTVGGTATTGTDYTALGGSVTVLAGSTTAFIDVTTADDPLVEASETVVVTLTGISAGDGDIRIRSDANIATVTITDDDTALVSIATTSNGAEPGTSGLFTVSMTNASATDTVLTYSVSGTAVAGSDYSALAGTVTIVAGATSATIAVPVLNDALVEATETVTVTLTGVAGDPDITIDGGAAGATVNIADNDTALVSVATTGNGAELGTSGLFTVSMSNASSTDTVIAYSLGGTALAGSDYTALSGSVTILAGATSANISVPVLNDALVEATETVVVTLASVSSGDPDIAIGAGAPVASIDIADDDTALASVAATDPSAGEPGNPGRFTVSLTNASSTDTVVAYAIGGTAVAGSDYTMLSGTVTILAGSTSASIDVAVLDELLVEGDETVIVMLTGISSGDPDIGIDGAADNATVTIADDDTAQVAIAATTNASEAGVTGRFTVSLSAAASTDTVVTYAVAGSAAAGTDYAVLAGSVTIAAGTTTAFIDVTAVDDAIVEADETIVVTLVSILSGDPQIAIGGGANAAGIAILDNDTALVSIASTTNGAEPGSNGLFTVSMSNASATDTVITYTVGGTASGGSDYVALSGTATILAGAASADIDLAVLDDLLVELDETVIVTLTGVAAGDPDIAVDGAANAATVSILDDDTAQVSIAATTPDATETGAIGRFTLSLSLPASADTVIAYTLGGTAANGADYALSGTVTIAAGDTSAVIDISAVDDAIVEATETVMITLTSITAGDADITIDAGGATATVAITDNDAAALTVGGVTVNESAGTMTFTVTLNAEVQGGLTVDALFANLTATGGGDFANATQTLIFTGTANESRTLTMAIADDDIVEAAESFTVSLGNVTPLTASASSIDASDTALGTILDNDAAVLTVADAVANENAGTITFAVSLDLAVQGGFSVDAVLSSLTALAGVDFAGATQTLTFAGNAGEVQLLTVPIAIDPLVESAETFLVSLANVSPATATAGAFTLTDTAVGTLLNDDHAPTLAAAAVALPENSPLATLAIDLADAVTGTDLDPDGDAITYAIVAGNGAGAFAIDPATGVLTVANMGPLDFETTPTFVLTVQATDGTNTNAAAVTVNVQNVNEAPTASAPGARTVAEDTPMTFSGAGGNAIVVGDVDAAALRVTFTAAQGTLTLASVAGLAFTTGDGVADAALTFSGSIAAINAALDGLAYLGNADYNGAASISMLLEDLGQSGLGGPLTAAASIAVTVTPVNDAPSIAGDLALLALEGQSVRVLSPDLLGVDVDDGGVGLVFDVIAAPGRGRMEFADAPGVAIAAFTQADLDAGRVRYVHDGSETTSDAFTLRLRDGGEDGAAAALGTLSVVVVPVNDAPVLSTGGTDLDSGSRIVLTSSLVSATDPDDAVEGLLFTLDTVLGGYVELATAPGLPIAAFSGAQLNSGLVRFVQADLATAPAFRVTVSDGEAADGPRAVVLTLRAAGGVQNPWAAVEVPGNALAPLAGFRSDTRAAEVRAPEMVPFLREAVVAAPAPTLAEPQSVAPAFTRSRVAGAVVENPRIEVAAAGLRFEPPPLGEVTVPRIDFSFDPGRHDIAAPQDETPLGLAALDAVRVAGLALTAGGVWWVFRMGSVIGSALVSAPAWRHIDPLPVLGGGGPEPVEWDAPDQPPPNEAADAGEQYFAPDAPREAANSPRS